jgi:hypothetical protein
MVTLELTDSECRILAHILESDLSDLRMEIAGTDRLEFRQRLKTRKQVIAKVLEAIHSGAPAT